MGNATIKEPPKLPNSREYFNNWLNLKVVEYYNTHPSDAGVEGKFVSDYISQIYNRISSGVKINYMDPEGPFNGYRVELWNIIRAQKTNDNLDWNIEEFAGLTGVNQKITKICSNYAKNKGVYGHEFGHNYAHVCHVKNNPSSKIGNSLIEEYRKLRSKDFRPNTPQGERFAEDFNFFFGPDGIAGVKNPGDDANKGTGVRWANEVRGLKEFIRLLWPISKWLRQHDFKNFQYIPDQGAFKYERMTSWFTSQWEYLTKDGTFYRWDGSKWVIY